MKSNTSAFKGLVGSGCRWEKWNEKLYKKFPVVGADHGFLEKCLSTNRVLWNSVYSVASGSHVALCSSASNVALCFSDSSPLNLGKLDGDVAFGRIEEIAGDTYAYLGDAAGVVCVFQYSHARSQVHLIAKTRSSFPSSIEFIQPVQFDSLQPNTIQMWAISGQNVYLLSGSYSPQSSSPRSSSGHNPIELSVKYQFQLAVPTGSALLNVQVKYLANAVLNCSVRLIQFCSCVMCYCRR